MKRFLFTVVAIAGILFLAGCPNVQIPDDDTNEDTAGIYTLTVATTGTGTVTPDPDKAKYNEGEVVTLTAAAGTDFIFDSWSGDAAGTGGSVSVTMDGDKSVTALFKQLFGVSITIDGPGSVTVDPSKSEYIDGEEISLTAVPDTGKAFFRWTGDVDGYCHPTRTAAVTGDMAVTAAFMDSGVYYVRTGESGDGSLDSPWGSIQDAIDNVPTPSAVFVSAGTYNESISAREGVSLYGGFSADFSDRKYETATERENASYQTLLTSTTSGILGGEADPQTSFLCDGSSTAISSVTIIEGFSIEGGTSRHEAAVVCQGSSGGPYSSPTIRYNTISGVGDGANTLTSYGIYVEYGAPTISHNKITGNTTNSVMGRALRCSHVPEAMRIDHNVIYGGDNIGSQGATGIYIDQSPGINILVEYNTITGGYNSGRSAYGINDTQSTSIIRNNIIDGGSAYTASGSSINVVGINCSDCTVYNNIISAGKATNTATGTVGATTMGIASVGNTKIFNNTICGGQAVCGGSSSVHATGIYLTPAGNGSFVENNLIFCDYDSTLSVGIYLAQGFPDTMFNNTIFDSDLLLRRYDGTSNHDYTDTAGYETYLNGISSGTASGNVSIDLIDNGGSYYFADWDGADNDIFTMSDNDWNLTVDAPVNVRGGGLDLSVTFTDDYDGTTRTTSTPTGMTNVNAEGWSMGAFEED
jgi:hypothetical protein